jgi:hypothetical protein
MVSLKAAPTTRPVPSRMTTDCSSVPQLTSMASLGLVGYGKREEARDPVHVRLRVPRPERVNPERIGVQDFHEPRGRVPRRPEVAGLRLAAGEPGGYHPRHLQELPRAQPRRDDRGVPDAAVGLGPREVTGRQGRRQGLQPLPGDVRGPRVGAVWQGQWPAVRGVDRPPGKRFGPSPDGVPSGHGAPSFALATLRAHSKEQGAGRGIGRRATYFCART